MMLSGNHMSIFNRRPTKPDPPKNRALERAMHEVATNDNPQTRESLYKAILSSTLIVQGGAASGAEAGRGKYVADERTEVALKTIEDPPGNIVLPVFTDVEAFTSWTGAEEQWIALPAQRLFQSIAPGNIAEIRINPFRPEQTISRPGGTITRNEFMGLAQGLLPGSAVSTNTVQMKVWADQTVMIEKSAASLPAEALKRLVDHFEQIPDLQGAYLFQMSNKAVVSTVIGLHFAAEPAMPQMEQIMRGIGDTLKGAMPAGVSIDFMPLKSGPLLDTVQKVGTELLKKTQLQA